MTLATNYTLTQLIEAALDQPQPTPELVAALQKALTARQHHWRDRSRDA